MKRNKYESRKRFLGTIYNFKGVNNMGVRELRNKTARKTLKRLGYDTSDPKALIFRTMGDLIASSVSSVVSKTDMIVFLKDKIRKLEHDKY